MRFASLAGAKVYGIGAWNLIGEPADQQRLVIRGTLTLNHLSVLDHFSSPIATCFSAAIQRRLIWLSQSSLILWCYFMRLPALVSHLLSMLVSMMKMVDGCFSALMRF
jgi:hypothetical protein